MLIPLTRKKFEELVPSVATGDQYKYCWGKPPDFLRRLLISVVSVVVILLFSAILPEAFAIAEFMVAVIAGLYWLWSPVYLASRQNAKVRKYEYAGILQARVVDAFLTEELIGKEETVNKLGDLVIVENRERKLNLELEDESGFLTQVQVPLQRSHRVIRPGDIAEMVVMSNRPDLSRIAKVSDVYLPDYGLWISDYPYLRRDAFAEVSRQLNRRNQQRPFPS
jgi:hypothetical protein